MSDTASTPGKLTSEFSLAQLTSRLCMLVAFAGIVDASLPDKWQANKWVGIVMLIVGIAGKVLNAYGYTTARSAVKVAQLSMLLLLFCLPGRARAADGDGCTMFGARNQYAACLGTGAAIGILSAKGVSPLVGPVVMGSIGFFPGQNHVSHLLPSVVVNAAFGQMILSKAPVVGSQFGFVPQFGGFKWFPLYTGLGIGGQCDGTRCVPIPLVTLTIEGEIAKLFAPT